MEVLSSRILLRPSDLESTRRFYRDVPLGLAVYREFGPAEDPRLVFFLGNGLLEVSGTADDAPGRPLRIWLQVRDVQAEHERLVAAGLAVVRLAVKAHKAVPSSWARFPITRQTAGQYVAQGWAGGDLPAQP